MSFASITNRLVEILEAEQDTLTQGLESRDLVIIPAYAHEHFRQQAIFVWRDSVSGLEYGTLSNPGYGADTHGEIEGTGTWIVATYLRYPADEETAANQLNVLAWNLLSVLRGYTADPENNWVAMVVESSDPDYQQPPTSQGWYVGERFHLRITWEMTF